MLRQIVPPEGFTNASLVLVGEAPGSQEERIGRPFVGPAGKLLNQCMHRAGVMRQECYLTNVIKERPRNNNIEDFLILGKITKTKAAERFPDGSSKSNGMSDSYLRYEAELLDELRECSATTIVTLGATPTWALLRKTGITKRRGSVYTSPSLPGKKIIPCIHPSAALRQYMFMHFIVFDLRRASHESRTTVLPWPDRTLRIRPSFQEALGYMSSARALDLVGFDIEVSLKTKCMTCFSIAKTPTDAMSIPLVDLSGDCFSPPQEVAIMRELAELLADPNVLKVGHNITGFDAPYLARQHSIVCRPLEDTMVAMGIAYPDFPKGLDFVTSIYTDEPYYKDDGKMFMKLGTSTFEDFWLYNAKDSAVCLEAWEPLWADLVNAGNDRTYRRQMSISDPVTFISTRGVAVDIQGLRAASEESANEIQALRDKLSQAAGFELNPNSPKAMAEYFYGTKQLKPYRNRSGGVTTDETALKRIARKGYSEASLVLELRGKLKEKSTYLDMEFDSDNHMRSQFNIVGTKTGRLASSQTIYETGGNMQNLTPRFKQFLIASPGFVGYEIDLSQAENRIVAYWAPEPKMIYAFENNVDVHSLTAAMIFDKDISDVSREKGSCTLGNGKLSERDWGKRSNHSLNYGLGHKQFALRYEMPEAEAKFIREKYYAAYPGVEQYQNRIRAMLRETRSVKNLLGRVRTFADRWGEDMFREAYATIPQSSVADIISGWGLSFVYERQDLFKPVALCNQVHDSIWLEIEGYDWLEHARILYAIKRNLEQPLPAHTDTFVIPAEIKLGVSFGKMVDLEWPESGELTVVAERLEACYAAADS